MNKYWIACAFILSFVLTACSGGSEGTDWPEQLPEAKPRVRWWWMGSAVDKENLTYNLETLSSAGIGGVEITPIYGVKGQEERYLDYLSPQWMEMLAWTESEGERLGMVTDMNMGTGWPFGGPEVNLEDAATKAVFREYTLTGGGRLTELIEPTDEKQKESARLSRLMAYSSAGECLDLTSKVQSDSRLDWEAKSGEDWKLIALFVGKTFQKVKRAAPGGQGYVLNHLDSGAVQRYFDKFEVAFTQSSTPYPHAFFNDSYEVYGADWTPDLLDRFEKKRGYKLEHYFSELLANGATDTSVRVISDYRETISELLKDNFTVPWSNWAHQRGIITRNQAHGSPANLIDIYASVDIPECESFGITDFDIPGLRKDSIRKENDGDPTTLKYASSAAHIAGKRFTSAETFTWLTEHFRTSLSGAKPELDQMFVSGVNHVYFHGNTYSPKEADWPGWKFYASVDMSPTNSIWKDAPAFFEYISRVQSFLQYGEPDNDFLLYLPMYDIWNDQRGKYFLTFAIHGMRERLPDFYNAVARVREAGYDLDYISDHFIRSATVENGWIKTEGGAAYKGLILPAVRLIPEETLKQIELLIQKGAVVVFADRYPEDVPGLSRLTERRNAFDKLIGRFPAVNSFRETSVHPLGKGKIITGMDYSEMLSASSVPKERFSIDWGGQYIRRKHPEGHHYFFTLLQNNPIDGWVPLAVDAESAVLFDPLTGESGVAQVKKESGVTSVFMQLKPGESVLLKTFSNRRVTAPEWKYYRPEKEVLELNKGWEMSFTDSEPAVNESFSLESLGSWTDLSYPDLKRNMGTARYKIEFDFTKTPGKEYRLSLGDVRESAKVYLNGKLVRTLFAVPFETNIGSFLLDGKNVLEVDVTNLPANRISDYDRRGVEWRKFHEINFVSITYKDVRFDTWAPVPSGLLGPVTVCELEEIKKK